MRFGRPVLGALRDTLTRVAGIVQWRTREDRLAEEIRFHVDMETEKNVRLGMSPADARSAALRSFGGRGRWSEAARDEYRSRPLADFAQDLRLAARSLRRYPLFA